MVNSNNADVMLKYYVGLASKIVGTMVGVGTALTTGDKFFSPLIGTSIAHTLEKVGLEIIERNISKRQGIRVGRAYTVARMRLAKLSESGAKLRTDGFFEPLGNSSSPAEEVTEAVLLSAMGSAEERKVDYIGALLANIAVNDRIDTETAHLLIQTADSMTFRSMILLKIASEKDRFGFSMRPRENAVELPSSLHPPLIEIFNLVRHGTIEQKDFLEDIDSYALLGFEEIDPAKLFPTPFGDLLYEGLDLGSMDANDHLLEKNIKALREITHCDISTSITTSNITATSSELLKQGDLVNIYNEESGVAKVRRADFRKKRTVSGFVRRDFALGENVTIFTTGEIRRYRSLKPGHTYFLGENGEITETPLDISDTYTQSVGQANTSSILTLTIDDPILRA